MQTDTVNMQNGNPHLDDERLCALDHDAPTPNELAHLAACTVCRTERQAYLSLQLMAGTMGASHHVDGSRLTEWERLADGLRREGLLHPALVLEHDSAPFVVRTIALAPTPHVAPLESRPARITTPVWLRTAAAMLLMAGGAMFGRLSAGAPLLGNGGPSDGSPVTSATLASDDGFGSVQQASEVLYRAQRDYERASLWLAGHDTTVHDSDVYRARLAALDQMMAASRAALRDAPQDPVLNQYFLAAYTAREATLQALGGALPVDKSLERY